ncbi:MULTISPECIES: ParB/RepB/Spo0J family partition protein [Tissierellales]|jgi:ParB family chromosome partitioning protein|uniref:ParB/RepB/Spo0J family partition protein n=1 Tax=Acidilutibacter cellobiosedens TaxID=2507161 RepID=A0A410QH82_9FIRM|nr:MULTISPECIES: ParB/RepB/Spo0J family partition protein [Tissierellales]MBE6082946.1 ParB/RepB/Spo0J family partition protein [Tissierellaceae bacterium]QAT63321.1 ParB/RepB/Spo0J family partition protein [Acidilutibacter cellobiosedens]SCL96506.1 putative chromosome-partitioning protein ParB [Sporanaerobacter sp. PP17-6a]
MSTKKRGLGKGLSALIPDEPFEDVLEEDKNNIVDLDIDLIKPNKEQPRKNFDKDALEELKESIQNYGVIQPIIVRKIDKGYEIIAGERRWKAAKMASIKKIPCIVKNVEEFEGMKLSLIENLQRENLNPVEEAIAFKGLIDNYNITQEELSVAVGKSRPYITNSLRLLNLDSDILLSISDGKISSGHGRALLSIEDKKIQNEIAKNIIEKKLNVRETENIVNTVKNKKNSVKKSNKEDPFISEARDKFMKKLGTKVVIKHGKNKGKIEIEYYSPEDFERIMDIIIKN